MVLRCKHVLFKYGCIQKICCENPELPQNHYRKYFELVTAEDVDILWVSIIHGYHLPVIIFEQKLAD